MMSLTPFKVVFVLSVTTLNGCIAFQNLLIRNNYPGFAFSHSWRSHLRNHSSIQAKKSSVLLKSQIDVELEKPLGIILEEVEEGLPKGVLVGEIAESGSAFQSEFRDQLVGMKLTNVNGEDVSNMAFDDVMDRIINAPPTVSMSLQTLGEQSEEVIESTDNSIEFEVGTEVAITVLQEGKDSLTIENAKVGDNLRKTLLENNVEVYRGLKKKLGNCGGGGQCTFCAVEFLDSEGWSERSEYEDTRLSKNPTARLACLNNIMGPATIRVE